MKKPKKIRPDRAHPTPSQSTEHADGETTRPEMPDLEGRAPLPEELTGRASGTGDSLVALFDDGSAEHMADGFRGGSEDIPDDEATITIAEPRPGRREDRSDAE